MFYQMEYEKTLNFFSLNICPDGFDINKFIFLAQGEVNIEHVECLRGEECGIRVNIQRLTSHYMKFALQAQACHGLLPLRVICSGSLAYV